MSIRDQIHVLVVDDMSTSRIRIMQALEELRITNICPASSGTEALDLLARQPAHLVLSDFYMPGMNGIQLLSLLRAGEATRNIGFILITGRANREIVNRGKELGMNNFITKPFETMDLKSCLEAVIGRL
ncbi:MAG: response regulator [Paracoccus sp. (in: a-proteobacteria)]